ncbi:MAG: peptidase S41, partial [Acidobacteriota bacterium]
MRAVLTCLLYVLVLSLVLPESASADGSAAPIGYYRQPDLYGDTIVFVAEGDLWTADLREALGDGAIGRRLTSHPGAESRPTISPDGRSLAFRATYEGTGDVYVMPLTGGSPSRLTWSDA